jgi:hypothetical protein
MVQAQQGGVATSPATGTFTGVAVGAKSGGLIAVNVNGVIRNIQAARDLVVGTGDVVLVHRFGSLWAASSRLFTAAVAEMPAQIIELDPNPTVVTGQLAVLPVYTGTHLASGGWLPDQRLVYQGIKYGRPNATGAMFYGAKPASLAGATVTNATLQRIRQLDGSSPGSAASTLRLVTETTKPSGAPTLTSTTAGPTTMIGDDISFTIPNAWAQAMVDGTAGGLAFADADGSPWIQYGGRDLYPTAFTLLIDWSRTL